MEISLFAKMLHDPAFGHWKKLKYKYPDSFSSFMEALEQLYYKPLPLKDFQGVPLVYMSLGDGGNGQAVKLLLRPQQEAFGLAAAEEEILSSSAIESVDFDRDSVRSILKGLAPQDEAEDRILGQKQGLAFIADRQNPITTENLHRLYAMTIDAFLPMEDRLKPGKLYRHDEVFVVSDRVEHRGLPYRQLPQAMEALVDFAQKDDDLPDLVKAAILHFYIAYLHPYFDGNGRMARLVHLWFLVQRGYQTALFVPFSSLIARSRSAYYQAFTTVEENSRLSGVVDVTPFVQYMEQHVYHKLPQTTPNEAHLETYQKHLQAGQVTEKESQLWAFVLAAYGTQPFSTKMLERDYGQAAYATIRSFVQKFWGFGLLEKTPYANRIRYRVRD